MVKKMILINIPKEASLNVLIPKIKFRDTNSKGLQYINRVTWSGVIKPGNTDVEETVTGRLRYKEIQFIQVDITSREKIYDIGKAIFSKIKYPCVVEFVCDDTVIIGCCKFEKGKNNPADNVNKIMLFSHVLRKELLSPQAERMIEGINSQVSKGKGTIGEIYTEICNLVDSYKLSGTSRAHCDRLIEDMIGKTGLRKKEEIRQWCTPYEYHPVVSGNVFSGKKSSKYTLVHDYEELWYCFMKNPQIRQVIETRKYRDIEDLIYSIDSKNW
ncbi:MAG: DUF4391 domain-containing protein [Phocaeicola sp.]